MMRRAFAWMCLLAVGGLAAAPALADSRIFTVATDQPGVTITAAARDGVSLPVAGQGAGGTLFKIDSPNAVIACVNRLNLTASNGQRLDIVVDLCANDWSLVVQVGGVPGGSVPVTIATDDPTVTIDEVYLSRNAVPIVGRGGNGVRIQVPTDAGGNYCQQDLGLGLSDSRRIARVIDICNTAGNILVSLTGSGAAPPPVVAQPVPRPAPQPLPQAAGVWSAGGDQATVVLGYGVPGSAALLTASCRTGSGDAELRVALAAGLRRGAPVTVAASAGAFAQTYSGAGVDAGGQTLASFRAGINDGLWAALAREQAVSFAAGQAPPLVLSLKGSSAPVRQFLAGCAPQAASVVSPPAAIPPPAPQAGIGPGCENEGRVRSERGDTPATIVFRNRLGTPVGIFWINFNGQRQPILTLAPGQTAEQESYLGHFWLAADASGRCLGVYATPVGGGEAAIPAGY